MLAFEKNASLYWAARPVKWSWTTRAFVAAIAAVPILALMETTPESWWKQSGFETYPGTYVRMTDGNYPLCRPWRDPVPGAHKEAGVHVSTRFAALDGAFEKNLAILLPGDAEVTGIYCGMAEAKAPLAGCSVIHCPVNAHIQVEDSIYTRGRGVIVTFRNRQARRGQPTKVGVWVMWKENPSRP